MTNGKKFPQNKMQANIHMKLNVTMKITDHRFNKKISIKPGIKVA